MAKQAQIAGYHRRNHIKTTLGRSNYELYIMLIPGVILALLFYFFPMYGITMAFKKYNFIEGLMGGEWVGFKYFIQFFNDPFCYRVIRNTVALNILGLLFCFPLPILFSLLLNEMKNVKEKRLIQSISFLPYFISNVVIVGMMMKIFANEGPANQLLGSLRMEPKLFFSDPAYFRALFLGSGVWRNLGYSSILYIAALTAISPELYESASLDGANRFQKIVHITIPGLMPTIRILLLLEIGNMMNVGLEKVYLMYNPAIYETADVISTYTYRRGIENAEYSYSSAVGLFNSVCNFVLLIIGNYISKRISNEGIW